RRKALEGDTPVFMLGAQGLPHAVDVVDQVKGHLPAAVGGEGGGLAEITSGGDAAAERRLVGKIGQGGQEEPVGAGGGGGGVPQLDPVGGVVGREMHLAQRQGHRRRGRILHAGRSPVLRA